MCEYCKKCIAFNTDIYCEPKRCKHNKDGELIYCEDISYSTFKEQYKLNEEYESDTLVKNLIALYDELVEDLNTTKPEPGITKLKAQIDLLDDVFKYNELVEEI